MLPDDELSDVAMVSGFTYPVKGPGPEDLVQDWELAGVYLNDPSQGLSVKVWHLEAVYNEDTEEVDVVLSAPGGVAVGEPSRVLFSGEDITEVALAFDQNMNVVVAYVQDSEAKLYWWDPTETAMVHTTLPAGARSPRLCMDERRPFNISASDVLLSYVRGGNLYVCYQRDRYQDEILLRAGVGSDCYIVSMARNNQSRVQWRLRNYELTSDPGALIRVDPTLAETVEILHREAGIPPENIDVQELWNDTVPGLLVDTEEGLDGPMDELRKIYQFDKSQHDKKLVYKKRGREPVAWIPYRHLKPRQPASLEMIFDDEQELPTVVHVEHLDPTGGFAKNKQSASRRSNMVYTKEEERIKTQVVLTPDQAATAAVQILKKRWNEQVTYRFTTTIRYTALTTADVVMVEDAQGVWHRVRLEQKDEDSGDIDWEGRADAGTRAYGSTLIGQGLPPPTSTTPGVVVETLIEIVDCSPLMDQHDELGVYVAAAGAPGGTWSGYQLFVSVDGGSTHHEALSSSAASCIGESLSDLADETAEGHDFESTETVEVLVNFPLASISSSQLDAGGNRFCIGAELGQFGTADLLGMVGELYHYELSDLRRAKYGTAALLWPSGTRFVLMDDTVQFVQAQRSMIGQDLEYKPVSYGHSLDETTPTLYLFDDPESQKEWVPDDVQAVRDGVTDDVTVTFVPRPRLGQFGTPYHSKYWRGYRVKFSDNHTIDTMGDTVVYEAAPPGVTVQVCGLNEITGEGPYSAAVTPT